MRVATDFIYTQLDDYVEGNHCFEYYYESDETGEHPVEVQFKINVLDWIDIEYKLDYHKDTNLREVAEVEGMLYSEVQRYIEKHRKEYVRHNFSGEVEQIPYYEYS